MQFKRPGRAAFGLRARKRERRGFRRRECNEALLTIYFGIAMCGIYMHDAIKQDMEEEDSGFREDDLPTLADIPSISQQQAAILKQCAAVTLVDQNATKVLVEIQ